jgi:hypothetical protein
MSWLVTIKDGHLWKSLTKNLQRPGLFSNIGSLSVDAGSHLAEK